MRETLDEQRVATYFDYLQERKPESVLGVEPQTSSSTHALVNAYNGAEVGV